ncbi:MAG: hypothetical protein WC700_08835 [Gemmatimonadaceae bacterium]
MPSADQRSTIELRLVTPSMRAAIVDTLCGGVASCPAPVDRAFVGSRTGAAYLSAVRGGVTRFPGGIVAQRGQGPGEVQGASDVREDASGAVRVLSATTPRIDVVSGPGAPARAQVTAVGWGIAARLSSGGAFALLTGTAGAAGDSTTDTLIEQRFGANSSDTVLTFRVVSSAPLASSRGPFPPPGLFAGTRMITRTSADDIIVSDGTSNVIQWHERLADRRVRLTLPLTPRAVAQGEVAEAEAELLAKTPGGMFAGPWKADVRRRARDAARHHALVVRLGFADRGRLLVEVDAAESGGRRWTLVNKDAGSVQFINGDWSVVGGFDAAGRLLLCEERDLSTVCGWSAPITEVGK